jgi:hypothetical protein
MIYCTQGEHANHYTTDAVLNRIEIVIVIYLVSVPEMDGRPVAKCD